jgi:predicted secreted acid phosphatase
LTKDHRVAVFFITARYEYEREATVKNLRAAGYHDWDALIFRPEKHGNESEPPVSVYKSAVRKQLVMQGYDIILNVGDQDSDLIGGYADKAVKLPNPYYLTD